MVTKTNHVLFIVPHEDDELLLGGFFYEEFAKKPGVETFCYIATNGDYYSTNKATKRIKESRKLAKKIGLPVDHLLFGGFGDRWAGLHPYNADNGEVCVSHIGESTTYIPGHKSAESPPLPYTRKSYKQSIFSVLSAVWPDVIFLIGLDNHPDHIGLNLLTMECLKELVANNSAYSPIIFEKPVYDGGLFGLTDYFRRPIVETLPSVQNPIEPFLEWDKGIRFPLPKKYTQGYIFFNRLYRLSLVFHTQHLWRYSHRFINADWVLWRRDVHNPLLLATCTATSGDSHYLNDGKRIDFADVNYPSATIRGWSPDKGSHEARIHFIFADNTELSSLRFYFLGSCSCSISILVDHECAPLSQRNHSASKSNMLELSFEPTLTKQIIVDLRYDTPPTIGEIEGSCKETPIPDFMAEYLGDGTGNTHKRWNGRGKILFDIKCRMWRLCTAGYARLRRLFSK